MQSGGLDLSIVIESATTAQDAAGQPIETWTTFATVWAKRKDMRGSERFAGEQRLATRTATYRMYWLAGMHDRMRVKDDDGSYWDIVGIASDRRQNWMELACEARNAEAAV